MLAEVGEEIAERAGGVAEAIGGEGERELVDEEGAQGLVAAVVGKGGAEEAVGEVGHDYILTDKLNSTRVHVKYGNAGQRSQH